MLKKTDPSLSRLPVFIASLAICLAALEVAVKVPFTYPEGDFAESIEDYLRTGHVVSTFLPDSYPFFMGSVYRLAGVGGIIASQVVIYLLLALCSFYLLRLLLRDKRYAGLGVLLACLNPDLLSSITKLWDTLPTCLGFVAFTTLCVRLDRGISRGTLLALALVWGVSVSIRPNLALLLIPVVFVLWREDIGRWAVDSVFFTVTGFAVYAACNTLSHGSFYLPSNGPYNLFAGANPYAQYAFVHGYNGETGIDTALHALGIHFVSHHEPWLAPVFKGQALLFIRTHPAQWCWLMVIKLLNLLRPDLKAHSLASGAGVVKVLTSLCVPVWVLALAFGRRLLGRPDVLVIVIAVAYVLPFLITNSDPRFRVPLDTLALLHTSTLVLRYRVMRRSLPGTRINRVAAA